MKKTFSILLVDDEQDFLDPIAFWLETKGYIVRTASNGQEALQSINRKAPDIVLLDVNMPVMNGIDTLRNIREKHNGMPVIMITSELEKLPTLHDIGIDGFFPKGGALKQLEELLEPILRIRERMKPSK